ncbi:YadA-like family protein [Sphingosinicella sp. LHD-64]|uniref:YadA-like family protein n=1 Tax=Sphingosinicella sp. LHD-64 TaxID=3072139 RepID=UPI00280EA444|nr:YadA-like family protein [Sphingosinicella sp. LHD-64]MDQ8757881.1 YadA-like family protein [Sphingosinicella sp. LHD-64]
MPTRKNRHIGRKLLLSCALISATCATLVPARAQAQTAVVNVCTGIRLPRSAVTDVLGPVANGIVDPIEDRVNSILDVIAIIPIVGQLIPDLNTNVAGLLSNAAAGAPISLQVLDTNGNVVDPADGCNVQADGISLTNPAGIAIGGNQITGLGANGEAATAADIDAIAFGNSARADAGATGSIAIGADSRAGAANSVAIGAGSTATRGAQAGYAALGLDTAQTSTGEFSVGAAGATRQVTNVAAGSAATDAVNVAQLQGVADDVSAIDTRVTNNSTTIANHETRITALEAGGGGGGTPGPVRYADAATPTTPNAGTPTNEATLVGAAAGAVGLHNVRDGALAASSTDAVNGGQLFATNQQVADHETRITVIENSVTGSAISPIQYSNTATPTVPNGGTVSNDVTLVGAGGAPVAVHNVAAGRVAAGSTDAVNGDQLAATNTVAQEAVALGRNSVQYDAGGRSVTFGPGAAPVRLGNVAPGVAATDAVNVAQLQAGIQSAVAEAQAYIDARFDLLGRDMDSLRRDSEAGTAGALAAASLPQAVDAGRGMIAFGTGLFQGEGAFAMGLSTRTDNGRAVIRAGATIDTRGRAGANAGVGIQF